MQIFQGLSTGRLMFQAALGYGTATYLSYRYNQITKAQSDLRDIKDKKLFLHQVHDKVAEGYDDMMKVREFSNKTRKYRKVVLSYAAGDVLECGIGTGNSLQHYNQAQIDSFIGVDWSSNMLAQSFQKIDELKLEDKFPFAKHPDYHKKEKQYCKLMQVDCHQMPFKDDQFDCVVDLFSLQSYYDVDVVFSEMKRVCKPGGQILIISRGLSYFSMYNKYLQLKAAKDLLDSGYVEHLDVEKVIENVGGISLVHKERKNLGMTHVYILEVSSDKENGKSVR